MRRSILVGALVIGIAVLGVLAWRWGERGRTFSVEPGTEQAFDADQIRPNDRFTCHGYVVDVQSPGYGFEASSGLSAGTARDGSVTIFCPTELEPL